MTNGIISTVASASSSSAGVTGTAGTTASSKGFAGALVQAMGGTGGNGASASGTAVPAGLLGLMGLLGAQTAEQTSQNLLQLLAGLSEQLSGLDPNAELPADLQNQLAGLLQLLQNLLSQLGFAPESPETNGASALNTDPAASLAQGASAAGGLPVFQDLQRSLKQLNALLSRGAALPAEAFPLAEQLQKSIQAVSPQLSAAAQTANGQTTGSGNQSAAQQEAAKLVVPAEAQQAAAAVTPEIRKASAALRNPVWQFQTVNAAQGTEAEGMATQAAIEPAEASGQNGSAPAWTFLKGDNASLSANPLVSANAPAPAPVPVQQFAEQMGKYLVKQFVLTQANGSHEAKIMLHPEHLGQVDIKITIHNGQLTAQFVTENGAARDLLENQMSQLRTALQGQGLQVERMEVVQQPSSSATASFFQQNQRQPGSGQNGNGGNGRGTRGVYDDAPGFEAELDRTTSLREIGYGSSLNVKA